ncbi:MAG: glycosyl transferase [Leptolyngbya foveolarum]|uniref:Glycosyl transferase n=1 Tax=Leptolyngbya foveolarum TaxID=47253 RepID=A0A2W4UBV5_9CYAN|nr:MAG: glycosyl transferase [Leptolyngbya foveolarum]
MPTLYIAVTNHGFGHATRAASVATEVRQRCNLASIPLKLIMATRAPKWLLDSYLIGDYVHYPVGVDIGVLQSDSLTMDKAATLREVQAIQAAEDRIVAAEADYLRSQNVDLVLADLPPLMPKIAKAAGVPCWMMGNFGWDFIYRAWGDEFKPVVDWIEDCYSKGDRTFRLPFHEPMAAFPNITDVGLTGGIPKYTSEYLRKLMASDVPPERTALLTFGGLGLSQIPYDALKKFPNWQFITFDPQAPELPNLYRVRDRTMRPVDWMVMCDRIVSKPGYSTFAEACLLDKGIITITRDCFAEAPVLISGIQDYATHKIVEAADFFNGDWSFITADLQPPHKSEKLDKTGQAEIATAITAYLAEQMVGPPRHTHPVSKID